LAEADELIRVGACGDAEHRREGADRPDAVAQCEEDGDGWRKNGGSYVRSQDLVNGLLNGPQRFGGKVSMYMVGPRDTDQGFL
jgi:hypothetical protein